MPCSANYELGTCTIYEAIVTVWIAFLTVTWWERYEVSFHGLLHCLLGSLSALTTKEMSNLRCFGIQKAFPRHGISVTELTPTDLGNHNTRHSKLKATYIGAGSFPKSTNKDIHFRIHLHKTPIWDTKQSFSGVSYQIKCCRFKQR